MKHKIQKVELFIGVIIFLGGLLTYGLGVHQLLPVPRPDLVVYGTTLIGIILIFMGCDIFSKPTKEMQILENDERNIAITNASLANAYKVTLTLLVLVLFALVFMGYMSKVVFFSIAGVIAIGQITWVITARYYIKNRISEFANHIFIKRIYFPFCIILVSCFCRFVPKSRAKCSKKEHVIVSLYFQSHVLSQYVTFLCNASIHHNNFLLFQP